MFKYISPMGQVHFTINDLMNYDSVYFRDITLTFIKNFKQKIWWFNRFSDKTVLVTVPFYYSMTGDERFLMDAFVDDVVDKRVELNTDVIPRGHVTLTNVTPNFSELANPHTWMKSTIETESETYRIISKVVAMPITLTYDVEILVESEIDAFKCLAKVINTMQIYKFFDFEYKGVFIEAMLKMPEGQDITMPREQNLSNDSKRSIKYTIEVKSHYPIFDLNWDGNLDSLLVMLGINDPGGSSGPIVVNGNVEPGGFGSSVYLANKRVYWNLHMNNLTIEENPET